ncbi:hypothetical protein NOCD_04690 [Nocardioides cavernae]|uniref:hypothetical protein n=1 Tax=Nocardioides TaxID=1839 RepID=UPI0012E38807|nr:MULTISPECIES: hypothetical protein [Nocardioides]MCK9822775.1 hypothetical protein [Nocardioides cavernae]
MTMEAEVAAASTAKPTPPVGRWDRIAAWSLLAILVVMLGAAVVLGERAVTVSDLRAAIAAGDVTEVRMSEQLPEGSRGNASVTIRWRDHGIAYVTDVTQASSERQARKVRRPADEVVVGDVSDWLRTNGRQVTVTGPTNQHYSGIRTTIVGFDAPGWLTFVGLGVVCATLLLIGAIEPWRATRWGWAWLVLLTPVGVPLFLLFGGLTGLLRPRPGAYRLTGGWAFLLASAIGAGLR